MLKMKKMLLLAGIVITFSLLSIFNTYAQEGETAGGGEGGGGGGALTDYYLQLIETHTRSILAVVNSLPASLETITKMALNFLSDESEAGSKTSSIPDMQADFASLGSLYTQNTPGNAAYQQLQQNLAFDLFNAENKNIKADALFQQVPDINSLTYATLVGLPPFFKPPADGDSAALLNAAAYHYIKNAAGFSVQHIVPSLAWNQNDVLVKRYQGYYNAVVAVQSFSASVLSQLYLETRNNNPLLTQQNALITKASSSDWFAGIATKELGKVLREILMFNSQNYILLTQLVGLEKQLLTAQVMTNTLLVTNNQVNEAYMLARAKGVQPTV